MAVEVERDPDRGVAHLRLEVLRVRAGRDHQCGVGVAEVVEAEAGQLRAADGRPEYAVAEVVVVEDFAARRWEDETALVRLPCEQLAAKHMRGSAREVDAPARRSRLHGHELALIGAVLDLDGHGVEVDVAVAQREELALPQSG
ncbi:MAG: hypothetical protein M5U27_14070 [Gaiella sp.]|nr:hypothetical protein [Gaiella sp.]